MLKWILPATAVVVVVASGVVHGYWTHRWDGSNVLAEPTAKLDELPLDLGEWQGKKLELKTGTKEAGIAHLYRSYVNRVTGKEVSILVAYGRPGPVSIHTPDACYGAHGFQVTPSSRFTLPEAKGRPAADCWTAQMLKKTPSQQTHLRIFWAWNSSGKWENPGDPRGAFAHRPVLYKLYLVRDLVHPDEPLKDDPCVEFMHQLLPQLQKSLFPES